MNSRRYPCTNCGTCPGACRDSIEKQLEYRDGPTCWDSCTRGLTACPPKAEKCSLKQSVIRHLTADRAKAIRMIYALRAVGINIHPDKTRFGGYNLAPVK